MCKECSTENESTFHSAAETTAYTKISSDKLINYFGGSCKNQWSQCVTKGWKLNYKCQRKSVKEGGLILLTHVSPPCIITDVLKTDSVHYLSKDPVAVFTRLNSVGQLCQSHDTHTAQTPAIVKNKSLLAPAIFCTLHSDWVNIIISQSVLATVRKPTTRTTYYQ